MKQIFEDSLSEYEENIVEPKIDSKIDEKTQDLRDEVWDIKTNVDSIKEKIENINVNSNKSGKLEDATADLLRWFLLKDSEKLRNAKESLKEIWEYDSNQGTGDAGEILPKQFVSQIQTQTEKMSTFLNDVQQFNISGATNIPAEALSATGYGWVDENTAFNDFDIWLTDILLEPKKAGVITTFTRELIADNKSSTAVMDIAANQIAKKRSRFFDVNGFQWGANHTGLFNLSLPSEQIITTSWTAYTSLTENDLVSAIFAPNPDIQMGEMKFYLSNDVAAVIANFSDSTGRRTDLAKEFMTNGTIFGYKTEVLSWNRLPNNWSIGADSTFAIFWDLKSVALGRLEGMNMELWQKQGDFEKDRQSMKVRERVDWKNIFDNAIVQIKTSA